MSTNPFATTSAPQAAPVAAPQAAPVAAPQAAPVAAPQAAPVAAPQVAPVAAPQVAPVAAPQVAAAPEMMEGGKTRKPRKTPNRQMTADERKYVIANYATQSTNEIAAALNLTRQQVYRTVFESRLKLNERLAVAEQSGDAASVEKIRGLLAQLPEKPFGAGGGKKGSGVDNVLDSLLA